MIYLYLSIFAAPTLNLVRTKDVFFIGKTADAVNTEESIFIKTGSMYLNLHTSNVQTYHFTVYKKDENTSITCSLVKLNQFFAKRTQQ